MSSNEIEDVLSSIRRLVSEDLRPGGSRPPQAGAEPVAGDKLLLTPALRVVEAAETIPPAGDDEAVWPAGTFAATPPVAASVAGPVDEVVARLGAAVTEEEWESPFGDPEIWGAAEAEAKPVSGDATRPLPGFVARPRVTLDRAGLEDEFQPAPMIEFGDTEELEPEDLPEAGAAEPAAAPGRVERKEVSPPDDGSDWADAAEAAVYADLAQVAEDEVIAGLHDAQAGDMAFDEEVLRDLVRDLIREELAGSLGERITRNVRKLVRAEIARALAVREFE
ncbi:MAG: hypothetical protein Q7J44_18045 [Pseudotabrizicola sp.]|nr:hypothetical protein [Pseudotabrizicola sp.]